MKKVTTPRVHEVAEYFCDKHPDKLCYSTLKTSCWYGSAFDMLNIKANLCDDCLVELYDFLKQKFNIEPEEDDIFSDCQCSGSD